MGLTIHYQLHFKPNFETTGSLEARRLVEKARNLAKRMKRQGRVDAVGPLVSGRETRELGRWFVKYRHARHGKQWRDVWPKEAWMFVVDVGRDCEPLRLGLCKFPTHIWDLGGLRRTRLDNGWRLFGFSKTQYASLHGWEHFLRCHRAVVDLLAEWRTLGVRVKISDEGEYWPRRSVANLRRNVDEMNGIVAGMAGALKDADDGAGAGVQSPIFAHQDFERLEAEGEAQAGRMIRAARGEISRLLRMPRHRKARDSP